MKLDTQLGTAGLTHSSIHSLIWSSIYNLTQQDWHIAKHTSWHANWSICHSFKPSLLHKQRTNIMLYLVCTCWQDGEDTGLLLLPHTVGCPAQEAAVVHLRGGRVEGRGPAPIMNQYSGPLTNHRSVFRIIDQWQLSITRRSPWRCPRAGRAAAPCSCWTATCAGDHVNICNFI